MSITLELDHIAVAGETLEAATEAVEAALGVPLQAGGAHDVFFTHNTLLGLDDGLYLEAIAIDPRAPVPECPRWFDLDRFEGPPRLTNWICRTDDLDGLLTVLQEGVGRAVSLQRGDLYWQMAVPREGRLPFDNLHPALIQWGGDLHPADMLTQRGCRLRRLIIAHPRAEDLRRALDPYLQDARLVFEPGEQPQMMAEFDTPHGRRTVQ